MLVWLKVANIINHSIDIWTLFQKICDNFEASPACKEIKDKTSDLSNHPEEHLKQVCGRGISLRGIPPVHTYM